jgi:ribosomal protein S18 acetylase RimI-like enzyme
MQDNIIVENENEIRIIPFDPKYQEQVHELFINGLSTYTTVTPSGRASQVTFVKSKLAEGGDMYDINTTYMTEDSDYISEYGSPCKHFWIALDDRNDKVLGCVGVIMSTYDTTEKVIYESFGRDPSVLTPQNVCELVRMSVSEDARGKGLGAKLYNVLVSFARERGMKRIVLSTLEDMLLAVGLYKKLGFRLLMKSFVDVNFFKHVADAEGFQPEPVVVVHYGIDI